MINTGTFKYKGKEYLYIEFVELQEVKIYKMTKKDLLKYVYELHEQWFRENTIYLEYEEGGDYKCL